MKTARRLAVLTAWMCLASEGIRAQGTAFTFQGFLTTNGVPANGTYDFQFNLYDAATGGMIHAWQRVNAMGVTNGLFTVQLNFGAAAPPAPKRWLEIHAGPTGRSGFTLLTPRQNLTKPPHALTASNLAGVVSAGSAATDAGVSSFTNKANPSVGTIAVSRIELKQVSVGNKETIGKPAKPQE